MKEIKRGYVSNYLIVINFLMAILYLGWWFYFPHMGNKVLYFLLLFGEIYHVIMAMGFWRTIRKRDGNKIVNYSKDLNPSIDIFITVAGEPENIVEQTIKNAKNIQYPNFRIYVLNDGFIAGKDNWQEIEKLAQKMNVNCITRKSGGGAKAGNINNGLSQTRGELIAILDADMVPHKNFLSALVPYFGDEKVGFVQSPQYYKNYSENYVTQGAWDQQNFFFGPIMQGKNNLNSAFICGTNVLIRRKTLDDVGGMNEKSIAEDFLTSLYIHKKKWKSIYYPFVLCEGLAPEDLLSYYRQQHRWARGSMSILFRHNPFLKLGLSFSQRFEYLLSALYYFNGVIVLIDIIMPLIFLYFGIQPVSASTQSFAVFFIPYMFLNLYTLYIISDGNITFRAISFSQSAWFLQINALFSLLFNINTKFSVTPKKQQSGNFTYLIIPHLIYISLAIGGIIKNANNYGSNPAVTSNTAWAVFNIIIFLPFIRAAFKPGNEKSLKDNQANNLSLQV